MMLFPQSAKTVRAVDFSRWLDAGIVLAVVLACGVTLSMNVADPDLWGHVQYGRDALDYGLDRTTTYSYVAQGYPWINHEILAEYALAIGADWLGGPGLLIVKCLLGFAVIGSILWWAFRQGAGIIAACGLILLVATALGNHWSLRPQLATYVCFTLLLALFSYCFAGWEGRQQLVLDGQAAPLEYSVARLKLLWLAVPLFVVWTNSHGGFLAGLCVFLAYLGLRGIEAVVRKGRAADGLLVRFGMMGAAAIAATFFNPYGPLFHAWLYDDLKVPRPEIVEWRAPELFDPQFLPFWLLLAVCVASLVATRRSRDWTHITILGLILWQALTHHRHNSFFVIACGWWLPIHFDSLLRRLGIGEQVLADAESPRDPTPAQSAAFASAFSPRMKQALALLLCAAICISAVQLAGRLTTLRVECKHFPVGAADFIARRGLTGNMVCTFNWAQYILGAFGVRESDDSGIQIQIDGRCRTAYSQEMLDMHFDFLLGNVGPDQRYRDPSSGPFDPERVLHAERPDLVLISRLQEPSALVMAKQKGRWVLLYQDSLAQLWGRSSRYDDPTSIYYLPTDDREIGDALQHGYVRWPGVPKRVSSASNESSPRTASGWAAPHNL